jgi:hypothetical protein
MSDSTLARAQRTIESVLREKSDTLDLHGLGLKTLPPLPAELNTLRRLNLSGNRLRELPPEVWQLVHLEALDLGDNRIATLGPGIGNLRALRWLDLSENRLTALPAELAACTSLEHLSLFDNQFSILPDTVLKLAGLQSLDVARNRLKALPDLRPLARLQVLDVAANQLSALPPELAAMNELRVLDLSCNNLTSVDAVLPASLQELFLNDNMLSEIPSALHSIARLSARGNPLEQPAKPLSAGPSLRDLVVGGYESGKRYFEAPEHRFGFTLNLRDRQAVVSSLNLYFKTFAGTPVSMRLGDGSRVDLTRVGRKAALDIADPSGHVVLEFQPTSETRTVDVTCEFAERVLDRIPDAVLVEAGGTQVSSSGGGHDVDVSKSAKPAEPPAPEPALEVARGDDGVSLPAAVPTPDHGSAMRAPSAAGAQAVDTAVFCPPAVARDSVFLVQVFAYPPDAAAKVDAQARQVDAASERRGTYSLPLDVPLGTRLDLHLEMPALTVAEPDAVLVWRGSPTAAQFEVAVPKEAAGAQSIGRVRIAVAGVPAGTLRFQVALTAAGTPPGVADARELWIRRYRHAFVSYSSKDRPEVLRRVQAFRIAGLSVFQDILDLDPGERWEKALYREIDRCDVFLLFWSKEAAASEWVGREIDYALARKQGDDERPPDIQPVPIEGPPIVPPPASLKNLHFNDALLAQIYAADAAAAPKPTGD